MDYIAHCCTNCGVINVLPAKFSDGYACCCCGGYLTPIGEAAIVRRSTKKNTVQINVEYVGTDKILSQLKEIEETARRVKGELSHIKEFIK